MITYRCAKCGLWFPADETVRRYDWPNVDKRYCRPCHEAITTEEKK